MLGTVGQLLILTAFAAIIVSGISFFLASRSDSPESSDWKRIGRAAWGVVTGSVVIASVILLYFIMTHQFQYAYVYQYTSRSLPGHFLFSAFWAGQEGSFLLWILLTSVIGLVVIRTAKDFEAPVLTIISGAQFFLLSMIVGLQFGSVTIGSSPFMSLAEKFPEAPIFQQQPNFVPADGNGLNDLLQNYWMVIHPPTLFVGFAAMVVPFAFAVTALWKRRYTEWVRPALPWALFATMVLGTGIALGGYWAYVTLSFGGYWAWDPVENSSLVPWLVGVAAIHTMISQKKSGSSHKASLLLTIMAYVLVVYSTFLTRSGILGDISVHSFVDLGLHSQLLLWILTMMFVGTGLFIYRYRELPVPERETRTLSREFMIFSGAMLLTATAAVILVGTSAPIFGRLFRESPSAVPIAFYNKWTLPLTVGFVLLAGVGQLFWWQKMSVENLNRVLIKPMVLSVVSTIVVLIFTPFVQRTIEPIAANTAPSPPVALAGVLAGLGSFWEQYGASILLLLLLFAAFFAFYGNGMVLLRIARGNIRLAGGAVAHLGLVFTILGIISSSGFSNPLAHNTGVQMGENRDNFIINRGETRSVSNYQVTYRDKKLTEEGRSVYVLDFVTPTGRTFTLEPVVYQNKSGQWIQHPDLQMYFEKDIYAAVSPNVMFGPDTGSGNELRLARNDSTVIGDNAFSVHFVGFDTRVDPSLIPSDSIQIAVAAVLEVTNLKTSETRTLRPIYMIANDRTQQFIQTRVNDWDLMVAFTGMNVDTGEAHFFVEGAEIRPEDWLVVQAYEKPFINLLWFGILLLTAGFILSIYRRVQDYRFSLRRLPA